MNKIYTGRTMELAVEEAEKDLGLTKEKFNYEIIEYPARGFLGIGFKPAKISVTVEVSPEKAAEDFIDGLFGLCGISGYKTDISVDGEFINIQIDGEEASLFVTKQFDTVEALQMLISLAVNRETENHYKVSLNVNDYKEKTQARLESLAMKIAGQVQQSHRKVTLNSMSSFQRRIIHTKLQEVENITTFSIGEEPDRRVIIAYNGPDAERKPRRVGLQTNEGAKRQPDYAKRQPQNIKPKFDAAKPQAETVKPQPDAAKPQPEAVKPQTDAAKPQSETVTPQKAEDSLPAGIKPFQGVEIREQRGSGYRKEGGYKGKSGYNNNRGDRRNDDRKPREFVPQEVPADVKPFFPIYKPGEETKKENGKNSK